MGGTLVNSRTGFQPVSPMGNSGRTEHPVTSSPRHPVRPRDGFHFLRVLLGLILLLAAGLKAHQLATDPLVTLAPRPSSLAPLLHSRPFLIAVVECELLFGLVLLSGIFPGKGDRSNLPERPNGTAGGTGRMSNNNSPLPSAGEGQGVRGRTFSEPRLTWALSLLCFAGFALISLYKGISGDATCGCWRVGPSRVASGMSALSNGGKVSVFGLVVCLAAALHHVTGKSAWAGDISWGSGEGRAQETARMSCGPNALYLLLKCSGISVPLEDLAFAMRAGARGSNMLDLKAAAGKYGLRCEVCRYSMDQLVACRKPVLVHCMESWSFSSAGHFVVVVGADRSNGIVYIGPIEARVVRLPINSFEKLWSGNVLQPVEAVGVWCAVLVTEALSVGFVGAILAACGGRRKKAAATMLGVAAAILSPGCSTQATDLDNRGPREEMVWRCPENDGVNCLYVLLHVHGYAADYRELIARAAVWCSQQHDRVA